MTAEKKKPASTGNSKKAVNEDRKTDGKKVEKSKVTYQFKYSRPHYVLPFKDANARPIGDTNKRPNAVLKVRNFRVDLDLSVKKDRDVHEFLQKHPQLGINHWIMEDVGKQTSGERADTLKKLSEMPLRQLRTMLTPEEWEEAGVHPGGRDKWQLIMAIIDMKKIN